MSEKLAEMTPSFLMRAARTGADSQGKAVGASSLLQALRQTCGSKAFGEARQQVTLWGPFETSSPVLQPISRSDCLRWNICVLSPVRHSSTTPLKSCSRLFVASEHCSRIAIPQTLRPMQNIGGFAKDIVTYICHLQHTKHPLTLLQASSDSLCQQHMIKLK